MKKVVYKPELLTKLTVIKKVAFELARINEDKSKEQFIEEIETIEDLLEELKQLIESQNENHL